MRVTHNNPSPEFQPIELTITIESEEEFAGLYRRLTVPSTIIEDNYTKSNSFDGVYSSPLNPLFEELYNIANDRGYIE